MDLLTHLLYNLLYTACLCTVTTDITIITGTVITIYDVTDSNFWNPARTGCGRIHTESLTDIHQSVLLESHSVMAATLLCMQMMCMKLCNLCINCSELMSVIWSALLLLHIVTNGCKMMVHQTVGCEAQLAERRSLASELTLSCARTAADGWPLCG